MARLIIFFIIAVFILFSAVMSVATKRIMRAATYLLFVLFGTAGIYFLLDYTFLGTVQVAVYAGGVTMLYVFSIQLMSKRTLAGLFERLHGGRVVAGLSATLVGLVMVLFVLLKNKFIDMATTSNSEISMSQIGHILMGTGKYQYELPFEFISVFLLACIIGGILISRKE